MKKKALFLALIFLLQAVWGFAAENPEDLNKDVEKIEIAFQIGSDVLKINGKDTKVETAPYVVGEGVTMVPIRVITEAFGAVVDWNEEEQSITITYNGVEMRLVVGSIEATINGRKLTMLSPPEVTNDRTMVPLRFISENFGADVSYDEKTDSVLVVKESFGDPDLDNYNSILKKTDKERVGDSFYKWSMRVPKELRIAERTFDGASTYFASSYATLGVEIVPIFNEDGEFSLDKLYIKMKEQASKSPNVLKSQNKGTQGGQPYVEVSFQDSKYQYDQRAFYKNNKVYYLWAIRDLNGGNQDKVILEEAKESFEIQYLYANDTEDLSNVKGGMRTFEDKAMGVSMQIPAEWMMMSGSTDNRMKFGIPNEKLLGYFYIDIFSKDSGETAESWSARSIKNYKYMYNEKRLKTTNPETIAVSGLPGIHVRHDVKTKDAKTNLSMEYYYVMGQNYKYSLSLVFDKAMESDLARMKEARNMISSFAIKEPDASVVGKLQEPDSAYADDKVTDTVKLGDGLYQIKIPTKWIRFDKTSKEVDTFADPSGAYFAATVSFREINVPQMEIFRSAWEASVKKNHPNVSFENRNVLAVDVKNATVESMYYTYPTDDGDWINSYSFAIKTKFGDYYIIECQVYDHMDGQRAKDLFKGILSSFERIK